jgi:hypothetical protein
MHSRTTSSKDGDALKHSSHVRTREQKNKKENEEERGSLTHAQVDDDSAQQFRGRREKTNHNKTTSSERKGQETQVQENKITR